VKNGAVGRHKKNFEIDHAGDELSGRTSSAAGDVENGAAGRHKKNFEIDHARRRAERPTSSAAGGPSRKG
jgi:hypothetical protein